MRRLRKQVDSHRNHHNLGLFVPTSERKAATFFNRNTRITVEQVSIQERRAYLLVKPLIRGQVRVQDFAQEELDFLSAQDKRVHTRRL